MYLTQQARGLGQTGPACLVGPGPLQIGQDYCASVDSVTVAAQAGTGPLCLSGFLFPWLGRLEYDPAVEDFACVDLLKYNGVALPSIVPAVVTAGVAFLLLRAVMGGGR